MFSNGKGSVFQRVGSPKAELHSARAEQQSQQHLKVSPNSGFTHFKKPLEAAESGKEKQHF